MNFDKKIRELRKNRNLTQEQLATALGISSQAISKWEIGTSLPDLTMIPSIAAFFHVSTDELLGYNIGNIEEEIEKIRLEANNYFWSNYEKGEKILLDGIKCYPDSTKLKTELFEVYSYNWSKRDDILDKALELYIQIINTSQNVFEICRTKANLIYIYEDLDEEKGQDHTAEIEKIIDSLPYMYPYMLQDKMRLSASCLKGDKAIEEAKQLKDIEWQELFIACDTLGERYFEKEDYQKALDNYQESVDVIERFMFPDKTGYEAYPIEGTHANHAITLLKTAACLHRLGRENEIFEVIEKAEKVYFDAYSPETARDYAGEMTEQIEYFREKYEELKLDSFKLFDSSEYEKWIEEYKSKKA